MSHASKTLAGVKVVDLGLGMGSALVTKQLVELGAEVVRIEPAAGDPFYNSLPAYRAWQGGKRILHSDTVLGDSTAAELANADICIVGGEDVPGLDWRPDTGLLTARYPQLVILALDGNPPGSPAAGRPAAEVLAAARSGAVFEHFTDRPILPAMPVASYGQAAQASVAVLAALYQRRRSGRGRITRVSLYSGALMWCQTSWMAVDKPDAAYIANMPKNAQQLIFRCADSVYIHITMGVPGAKERLYEVLRLAVEPTAAGDRALPSTKADPRNFFGEFDLLQAAIDQWASGDLLAALVREGIPVEPLLPPGGCWDDPQVCHNGVLKTDLDGITHVGLPLELHAGTAWPASASTATTAAATATLTSDTAPLAGLRILDLGTVIAGPYSSMLLADLGAEVIRVEALGGDIIRVFTRWFASVSRGKRCVAADFKHPEAVELVHRLAAEAHIAHHNFRPGVAERLGIGAAQLRARNPQLVVLETYGYGADGPKAGLPGFDMVFQAHCGHELRGGGTAHRPLWYRAAVVDTMAGAIGAAGLLAALLHPQRAGATVRTNLLNAGVHLLSELIRDTDGHFRGAPVADADQLGSNPAERLYRTRDGWIALAIRGDAMAAALSDTLGLQGKLGNDPAVWTEKESTAITTALATQNLQTIAAELDRAGIWNEPCRPTVESELLAGTSPDTTRFRLTGEVPRYGKVVQIGPLFEFPYTPLQPKAAFSAIGQDTDSVLQNAGYTIDQIAELRQRKVIR